MPSRSTPPAAGLVSGRSHFLLATLSGWAFMSLSSLFSVLYQDKAMGLRLQHLPCGLGTSKSGIYEVT